MSGQTSIWSESFNYDQFGNRWVSGSGGLPISPTTVQSNAYNTATNQLTGLNFAYDSSGNQTTISPYTIMYDAENRQTSVNSMISGPTTYAYDGDGRRVQKTSGGVTTTYLYDAAGDLAAEYSTAPVDMPCTTCFLTSDHLGSTRLITDQSGISQAQHDFLPFGEEINSTSNRTSANGYGVMDFVTQKFTGKERDQESGLDYFGARYYASSMGRFMSPDPKQPSIKHLMNPQKWNKYAYVLNNPLSLVDPDGLEEIMVQLRAYIPQASVGPYRGDNRGPTASQNVTSRTSITLRIETDPKISANPLLSNSGGQAGVTHNDLTGNSATQTQGLPNAQVSRDANGNVVINIKQDAPNPLTPQGVTPGIKSDLTVNVPVNGTSVTTSGTVSGSPAFELNVGTPGNDTTNIPLQGASGNSIMFGIGLTQTNKLPQTTTPPPAPRCTAGQSGCSQ